MSELQVTGSPDLAAMFLVSGQPPACWSARWVGGSGAAAGQNSDLVLAGVLWWTGRRYQLCI